MGVLGDAPRASAICLCHAEQSSCAHTPATSIVSPGLMCTFSTRCIGYISELDGFCSSASLDSLARFQLLRLNLNKMKCSVYTFQLLSSAVARYHLLLLLLCSKWPSRGTTQS